MITIDKKVWTGCTYCNTTAKKKEYWHFCPHCGKPLDLRGWAILEKSAALGVHKDSEWIDLQDRSKQPKIGERIILSGEKYVGEGYLNSTDTPDDFRRLYGLRFDVLEKPKWWMPLPLPPDKSKKD